MVALFVLCFLVCGGFIFGCFYFWFPLELYSVELVNPYLSISIVFLVESLLVLDFVL